MVLSEGRDIVRAEGSVTHNPTPYYKVEAWLEATPDESGCKFQGGTITADKLAVGGFLVTAGVITERLTKYTKAAPAGSDCDEIECYRYYVHFATVMGIGVSVSQVGGVSGNWIMAQHDHYVDLRICADGSRSSTVRATRTKGPAGDHLHLRAAASDTPTEKDVRLP